VRVGVWYTSGAGGEYCGFGATIKVQNSGLVLTGDTQGCPHNRIPVVGVLTPGLLCPGSRKGRVFANRNPLKAGREKCQGQQEADFKETDTQWQPTKGYDPWQERQKGQPGHQRETFNFKKGKNENFPELQKREKKKRLRVVK